MKKIPRFIKRFDCITKLCREKIFNIHGVGKGLSSVSLFYLHIWNSDRFGFFSVVFGFSDVANDCKQTEKNFNKTIQTNLLCGRVTVLCIGMGALYLLWMCILCVCVYYCYVVAVFVWQHSLWLPNASNVLSPKEEHVLCARFLYLP